MGAESNSPTSLRPYQFTLARMVSWVIVSAGLCFLVRNIVLLVAAGLSLLPALIGWSLLAAFGLVGALWNRFWDMLPGRVLLRVMFLLVAIPFSPLLLFCIDWERWVAHWRMLGKHETSNQRLARDQRQSSVRSA